MANYQNLLDSIASVIHQNGNQEITGEVLKSTLQSMVSVLGANASYGGVAHISDNPGTPDGPVVYIASDVGTYPNFGGLTVDTDELAVFVWDTNTWSKESITYIADKSEIEQLIQEGINDIEEVKTDAINEINTIVQSVDVTYDTISGTNPRNVQLKNGDGDVMLPNIAVDDLSTDRLSLSDLNENKSLSIDTELKVYGKVVPTLKNIQTDNDFELSDGENSILSIKDGRIKTICFDSDFPNDKYSLLLPDYINSWVGDNVQIFKYPVTINPVTDSLGVNFSVDSSDTSITKKGRTLRRYFEFTPSVTGTFRIKANLLDARRRLHDSTSFEIHVLSPTSPASMKNILFIGDSETQGQMNNSDITSAMGASVEKNSFFSFVNEVKRLLTGNDSAQPALPASIGLSNIQMIGTQNTSDGRHEGYGGKDVAWFMSSSSPFYIGGKIDFNAYLAQNSVYDNTSKKGVDIIYIMLGANNTNDYIAYKDRIYVMKTQYDMQMTNLINTIKTQLIDDSSKTYYNPNLKIVLLNYAFPYIDGRGYHPYGSNEYGDNIGSLQGYLICYNINKKLKNSYSGIVDNILISPQVDSENAYAYFEKEKNNYMTEKELTRIEAVHPNEIGYRQFGSAVVRDIIGRI